MSKAVLSRAAALSMLVLGCLASEGLANAGATPMQLAQLFASGPTFMFGSSVAISTDGTTVVVGEGWSTNSPGAAYVFVKPTSGWQNMTQVAVLMPSDSQNGDAFGLSVAISGNTIAVGAPGAKGGVGQAYVFVKPASGWANMKETAKLTSSTPQGLRVGHAVATTGDTVYVGLSPTVTSTAVVAYVYEQPVAGWSGAVAPAATLSASNGQALGGGIGVSGNVVVEGPFIFAKPASGWANMTETARLSLSPSSLGDLANASVAISGNTIVEMNFVFVEPAGGWANMTQTATLSGSNGLPPPVASAMDGDTIVLGASHYAPSRYQRVTGVAYVYTKPANGWTNMRETQKLPSPGGAGSFFGSAVGVSGSMLAIGASAIYSGSAYLYGP